jgi:hypothetical protein
VTFVIFFVVGVVVAGALGIWWHVYVALVHGHWKIYPFRQALQTYSPAVAIPSSFELIISADHPKFVRSFAIFAGAVAVVVAMVAAAAPPILSLVLGLAGAALAWLMWVVANAENRAYQDGAASAATGGDPGGAVNGDLSGFIS